MNKKQLRMYKKNLSWEKKERVYKRACIIYQEHLLKGFTIGMVELLGEEIKKQAKEMINK